MCSKPSEEYDQSNRCLALRSVCRKHEQICTVSDEAEAGRAELQVFGAAGGSEDVEDLAC